MGIKAGLKILSVPPSTLSYEEIKKSPGFYQAGSVSSVIYVNDKGEAFYMNLNKLETANPRVWMDKSFIKVQAEFTIKSED